MSSLSFNNGVPEYTHQRCKCFTANALFFQSNLFSLFILIFNQHAESVQFNKFTNSIKLCIESKCSVCTPHVFENTPPPPLSKTPKLIQIHEYIRIFPKDVPIFKKNIVATRSGGLTLQRKNLVGPFF